jgi:hypothetical protein
MFQQRLKKKISIRAFNLAVVWATTNKLTNCSFRVVKQDCSFSVKWFPFMLVKRCPSEDGQLWQKHVKDK